MEVHSGRVFCMPFFLKHINSNILQEHSRSASILMPLPYSASSWERVSSCFTVWNPAFKTFFQSVDLWYHTLSMPPHTTICAQTCATMTTPGRSCWFVGRILSEQACWWNSQSRTDGHLTHRGRNHPLSWCRSGWPNSERTGNRTVSSRMRSLCCHSLADKYNDRQMLESSVLFQPWISLQSLWTKCTVCMCICSRHTYCLVDIVDQLV